MINRKDWETTKKVFEDLSKNADNQIVNAQINLELYEILKPFIETNS